MSSKTERIVAASVAVAARPVSGVAAGVLLVYVAVHRLRRTPHKTAPWVLTDYRHAVHQLKVVTKLPDELAK